MSIDSDLDRLYQLPPSAFIAERNALAKRAGARGPEIKALPKPTAPVWVVNQLHWRHPEIYQRLIESAENLRATHKAVLAGRRGDLRAASRTHEETLDAALKAALAIAAEDGKAPSDAARQSIMTTLRALPSSDPPGRLRQALAPGGFEVLTGAPARGRVIPPTPPSRAQKASAKKTAAAAPAKKPDRAAVARARKAAADAARALSSAEQASRREEFEAARAARDADAAQRSLARAREALATAKGELEQAEEEAEVAIKKRDDARTRAAAADKALATARERADDAQRELRLAEEPA